MTIAPPRQVDEKLPAGRLLALGLQHVLVMYAGAVAVPLVVGRALKFSPEMVSQLISADLFCCGLVTLIQSLGMTRWFGIRQPVMMGVAFTSVVCFLSVAAMHPGVEGAGLIFGATIGGGVVAMLIAPILSRMLRFFPPLVTGIIITVIGLNLSRIGINWIFGNPFGPTAPVLVSPEHAKWLADASAAAALPGAAVHAVPKGLALAATVPNPRYADPTGVAIAAVVLVVILLISKFGRGFLSNISVLLGIATGAVLCAAMGLMPFTKVAQASWFSFVMPLSIARPRFDPILILTISLVLVVVMIESVGLFLALGEMTGTPVDRDAMTRGLRTDGLGAFLGGIFNTFPYTSFSQNVGLVAVTGIKSRFVCVAGAFILMLLGLLPKLSALVEALPTVVLGGAGIVMFGMVASTGIRILGRVDFKTNHNNALVVAIAIGIGLIPIIAPNFKQWMPISLHPLVDSGIVLTAIAAVGLNLFFNGAAQADEREIVLATRQADAH